MNWNRSSKVVLALFVLLAAAVAPVAAVDVQGNVPDSAEVGAQQDRTFTFTNLYTDYEEWTLHGQTDLTKVTWTVTAYDNAGNQIEQRTFTGQSFDYHIRASDGTTKVTVRLQGTTPPVDDWSYQPPQSLVFAEFQQTQQGGSATVLQSYDGVRPYTQQSQQARTQIQQAEAAIQNAQSAGAEVSEAKRLRQNAVEAYDSGNFDLAIDLADQAEQKAESAAQSSKLTRWALIGGAVVVVLLVLAGGAWYYLSNRETHDKLA